MNNGIFILKIAEDPNQEYYKTQIKLLEIQADFNYLVKNNIFTEKFNLLIWGDQIDNVLKYYRKSDYIVVEGIVNLSSELDKTTLKMKEKKIEITVLDIYLLFPVV
jgi:single-stranded DNA-binding protein